MPKQHPKMSKNGPNMVPKWAQVGTMLGSKIYLDASKNEKNATQDSLEKKIRKSIKKARSGRPPDGKYEGGLVVNYLISGPTFKISRKQHLHLSKNFKTRSFKPSTYSKLEASSHQVKLLLHSRFHLQAPLVL